MRSIRWNAVRRFSFNKFIRKCESFPLIESFVLDFSVELQRTMKPDVVSLDFINDYASLERQMAHSFQSNAGKNIREGNFKKSFNYLLIDPRIAENLLADSQVEIDHFWYVFLPYFWWVMKTFDFAVNSSIGALVSIFEIDLLSGQRQKQSTICPFVRCN